MLQRAPDRKGGGGRKQVNLSILAMDTNRKYHGTDNNHIIIINASYQVPRMKVLVNTAVLGTSSGYYAKIIVGEAEGTTDVS